jgi:hypothetical protein
VPDLRVPGDTVDRLCHGSKRKCRSLLIDELVCGCRNFSAPLHTTPGGAVRYARTVIVQQLVAQLLLPATPVGTSTSLTRSARCGFFSNGVLTAFPQCATPHRCKLEGIENSALMTQAGSSGPQIARIVRDDPYFWRATLLITRTHLRSPGFSCRDASNGLYRAWRVRYRRITAKRAFQNAKAMWIGSSTPVNLGANPG